MLEAGTGSKELGIWNFQDVIGRVAGFRRRHPTKPLRHWVRGVAMHLLFFSRVVELVDTQVSELEMVIFPIVSV